MHGQMAPKMLALTITSSAVAAYAESVDHHAALHEVVAVADPDAGHGWKPSVALSKSFDRVRMTLLLNRNRSLPVPPVSASAPVPPPARRCRRRPASVCVVVPPFRVLAARVAA